MGLIAYLSLLLACHQTTSCYLPSMPGKRRSVFKKGYWNPSSRYHFAKIISMATIGALTFDASSP